MLRCRAMASIAAVGDRDDHGVVRLGSSRHRGRPRAGRPLQHGIEEAVERPEAVFKAPRTARPKPVRRTHSASVTMSALRARTATRLPAFRTESLRVRSARRMTPAEDHEAEAEDSQAVHARAAAGEEENLTLMFRLAHLFESRTTGSLDGPEPPCKDAGAARRTPPPGRPCGKRDAEKLASGPTCRSMIARSRRRAEDERRRKLFLSRASTRRSDHRALTSCRYPCRCSRNFRSGHP